MNIPSTIQELGLGAALAAGAVTADALVPTDPSNIIMFLVEKFGIVFGLLAYFIVRDYWRYLDDKKERAELHAEIGSLNEYIKKRLEAQITANSNHIREHARITGTLIQLVEKDN